MVSTGSSLSTATSSPEARAFLRQAREVLQQLAVLIRNAYLHDLSNEVFEEPLEKAQTALASILTMEKSFRLERSGQEFYANGVRMRMEIRNLHAYKYVWGELDKRSLGGLQFAPTPSVKSLSGLLSALVEVRSAAEGSHEMVNTSLTDRGVSEIVALPPRPEEEDALDEESIGDRRQRAIEAYQQALDFIKESMLCSYAAGRYASQLAKQGTGLITTDIFDESCEKIKEQFDSRPTGGRLCKA